MSRPWLPVLRHVSANGTPWCVARNAAAYHNENAVSCCAYVRLLPAARRHVELCRSTASSHHCVPARSGGVDSGCFLPTPLLGGRAWQQLGHPGHEKCVRLQLVQPGIIQLSIVLQLDGCVLERPRKSSRQRLDIAC